MDALAVLSALGEDVVQLVLPAVLFGIGAGRYREREVFAIVEGQSLDLLHARGDRQGGQPGAGFDPSQAGPNPGAGQGGQDYYDADYTVVDDDNK